MNQSPRSVKVFSNYAFHHPQRLNQLEVCCTNKSHFEGGIRINYIFTLYKHHKIPFDASTDEVNKPGSEKKLLTFNISAANDSNFSDMTSLAIVFFGAVN